jgi:endonuclease/exonuclease/phosphatase family metal-dependent hydrolase
MAGDFNSTLDALNAHSTRAGSNFGECDDAAFARHGAANGTWPTSLPMVLGAQIDHVMTTDNWKPVSMKVIGTEDESGSDHRPIVVTLAPTS